MYLSPHSKSWTDDFEREVELIHSVYTDELKLHHIGSTAIPGLFAKDCIDILGVVPDLSRVMKEREAFPAVGYEPRGAYGIEGREYFSKKARKAHLHIFENGSPEVKKHLNFVKVMRTRPELIDEFNALKSSLQRKYPDDPSAYQLEKAVFYDRINKIIIN